MNSTLLHKIKLITILAIGVILVACGGAGGSGSNSNSSGGGDHEPIPVPTTTPTPLPTVTPTPSPTNVPIMESFSVVAQPYDSQYYTQASNAPYYTALLLTNNGTATQSLSITISGTNVGAFSIVPASASQYYPSIANVSVCPVSGSLDSGASCELIVKLSNPIVGSLQTASLNMSLGDLSSTKTLTQSPVIYIAGNFGQTYASNPVIAPVTADGAGVCGQSANEYCQLLKYDITTGQVSSVAITNNPISDIAVSPSGILTFAGGFTKAGTNASNLLAPTLSNLNVMVASLNPANNNITDDFANNESQTPNNAVNAIAYDNNGNLFITGVFTQIGNISIDSSNYSYLVAKLDTNGNLSNALGTNGNPSGFFQSPAYGNGLSSVYTMTFDTSNNLYLAGFFTQIGSTYIDTIDGNQTPGIVRCSLVSGAYDCTPTSTNVVVTNDGIFGLALDANANIYASGVFTSVDDVALSGNTLLGYDLSGTTTPVGWSSNMGASANSIIATVSVASNNQLYAGGAFSAIGTAFAPSAQGDVGTCGLNALSSTSNPTDACLFASYTNSAWSAVFGTDAWINTTALTSSIGIQ